MAESYRL